MVFFADMRHPCKSTFLLVTLAVAAACAKAPVSTRPTASRAPTELIGQFTDDYGNAFRVADSLFEQLPRGRFHVVEWNLGEQYFIARNGDTNPSDGGLWTRIDWMRFADMAPFTWGFCMTAYRAPTEAAARATPSANRATPRTGCNGHPFSRMRPATDSMRQPGARR